MREEKRIREERRAVRRSVSLVVFSGVRLVLSVNSIQNQEKKNKTEEREREREKTYRGGVDGEAGASLGGNSGGLEVNLFQKCERKRETKGGSERLSIKQIYVKKKRDPREKDNEKIKNGGDCANSKLRSWPELSLSSTSARARSRSLSRSGG